MTTGSIRPAASGAGQMAMHEDVADTPAIPARVGGGSLGVVGAKPALREESRQSISEFQSPPAPRQPVTLRLAEGALNRILSTFGPKVDGRSMTLEQFEQAPMGAMTLAASLLAVKGLGDVAQLKSLALEIRTHGAENIRLRQNEELREQTDKSIEDAGKARKAGIFSTIVDWIVSIAEVASGLFKLVFGDAAGGAMDIAAGCAGLVKAIAETIALTVDDETAKKYLAVAEDAGKAQLAFEIAGMAVDLISVGRGVMAAKSIPKAVASVMSEGAGEVLCDIVQQGAGKEAASFVAAAVASEVAERCVWEVQAELLNVISFGSKPLLKNFAEDGIKKLVSSAIEAVVANAAKGTVKNVLAEELSREIVKEVNRNIIRMAVKASVTSTQNLVKNGLRATANAAQQIDNAEIARERAGLQAIIKKLMNDNDLMMLFLEDFEKLKERSKHEIKDLIDSAGNALSSASSSMNKTGAVLSNIAHSMA